MAAVCGPGRPGLAALLSGRAGGPVGPGGSQEDKPQTRAIFLVLNFKKQWQFGITISR